MKDFANHNQGEFPAKIVIYRDGVGEQMRDQIIEKELSQFTAAMQPLFNKAADLPLITLIVVNKRINQRMFIAGRNGGQVENPPPGSIIDDSLVENQTDNQCFDFFLVPQQTT